MVNIFIKGELNNAIAYVSYQWGDLIKKDFNKFFLVQPFALQVFCFLLLVFVCSCCFILYIHIHLEYKVGKLLPSTAPTVGEMRGRLDWCWRPLWETLGGPLFQLCCLMTFLDMIITIAIKYNSLNFFIKLNYQPLRPNPCFMRNPFYILPFVICHVHTPLLAYGGVHC